MPRTERLPTGRHSPFSKASAAWALALGLLLAPTGARAQGIDIKDWSSASCRPCHQREWSEWSRSGHALTLEAQLANASHNAAELLDQTCLKCHSPELGAVKIGDVVAPIDQKGPWKLIGPYADSAGAPSISCKACHQQHSIPKSGLLSGMDFGDESTFYRNLPAATTTNLFIFDAYAQKYVEPQPIAPVIANGREISVEPTRSNRLCYTCHATARAESNLFEPQTPPSGDNTLGSVDDRTLTGAHQGIACVTCHMAGGSHTFNPMDSCAQCHGQGGATASLAYVQKVRTSYTDPSLSMLSGNFSPLNIHWLDTSKLTPAYQKGQ